MSLIDRRKRLKELKAVMRKGLKSIYGKQLKLIRHLVVDFDHSTRIMVEIEALMKQQELVCISREITVNKLYVMTKNIIYTVTIPRRFPFCPIQIKTLTTIHHPLVNHATGDMHIPNKFGSATTSITSIIATIGTIFEKDLNNPHLDNTGLFEGIIQQHNLIPLYSISSLGKGRLRLYKNKLSEDERVVRGYCALKAKPLLPYLQKIILNYYYLLRE